MAERIREWWRDTTEAVFKERLADLAEYQLHELMNDISATLANIDAQRQRGGPDADWVQRVRHASLAVVARRKLVRAELNSRNVNARTANHERKRRNVVTLRALLARGDLAGVLRQMIDDIDPDMRTQGVGKKEE